MFCFVWGLFVLTFSNPFSCFLSSGSPLCSFKIHIQSTFKSQNSQTKGKTPFICSSSLPLGLADRRCLAAAVTVPLARIVGFAGSALGVQTASILVLALLLMNFRGELYSPENLLLSSSLRLEPLARENLSRLATGLCGDKDFPCRTLEFSSLILIFLIARVWFGRGMSEQEWLQTLGISFRWVNVQSASSGICAWARCRRNRGESSAKPGLGKLHKARNGNAQALLEPRVRSSRSRDAAGMQLELGLAPAAEPCQCRALSRHKGAGGKAFKPAAVKMSFVGAQKARMG